jgi:cell division septation protein DedD
MSATVTNMIPVVLLGIMVALTLIFLPHLNDDPPRRPDEPQADEAPERPAEDRSSRGHKG